MFLTPSRSTKVFLRFFDNGICLPRKKRCIHVEHRLVCSSFWAFFQKCVPDRSDVRIISCSCSKYSISKNWRIIMQSLLRNWFSRRKLWMVHNRGSNMSVILKILTSRTFRSFGKCTFKCISVSWRRIYPRRWWLFPFVKCLSRWTDRLHTTKPDGQVR